MAAHMEGYVSRYGQFEDRDYVDMSISEFELFFDMRHVETIVTQGLRHCVLVEVVFFHDCSPREYYYVQRMDYNEWHKKYYSNQQKVDWQQEGF